MRPRLPTAREVLKYLEQIDSSRWYTNFGPLLKRFEKRLAEYFGLPEGCVVCVANGTLGLVLALRSIEAPAGSLCVMPAWTFVATPAAALAAGLTPWFVDVDEETWALEVGAVRDVLSHAEGRVAAAVPVSPFGAPIDGSVWEAFREETGIAVVLDMAHAFDSCDIGHAPSVVSLHATKVFGVGEGGLVATRDRELATRIRRSSNYGLETGARATSSGTNAKMSEYAAAVGLAGMDRWPEHRAVYRALAESYRDRLEARSDVRLSPSFGNGWTGSTCNVRVDWCEAGALIEALGEKGIEARKWWGDGCHRHPAYAHLPRASLPVTEALASAVVGLPFYPGLSDDEMDYVCETLRSLRSSRRTR